MPKMFINCEMYGIRLVYNITFCLLENHNAVYYLTYEYILQPAFNLRSCCATVLLLHV